MMDYSFKNKNFKGYVGVAQIDITPPVGIYARNWGAAKHDISTGNDLGLRAVCTTFKAHPNDTPLVLISVDLCVWRAAKVKDDILRTIRQTYTLEESQLVLCFTHTHAAPVLSPDEQSKAGGDKIVPYISYLTHQLVAVIEQSINNISPSIVTWHNGRCNLATNRDLWLADEQAYLTGFNPLQEADDTLLVGRIYDTENKKIKGTLVNYACHPTTLAWANSEVSADYVGYMRELVESFTATPTLFIQGASGELAPMEQYTKDLSIVKKNGRQLGFAILQVLENMLPPDQEIYFKEKVTSGADLAFWDYRPVQYNERLAAQISYPEFTLKPIPYLQEIEDRYADEQDRVEKEKLWRQRNIRLQFGDQDHARISLWTWQIGDALLVAQQNETYSAFQQSLRHEFHSHCVLVANIANGSAGYLPPQDFYTKNCYAVKQTPFEAGSLEELTTHAIHTVQKLLTHKS